MAWLCIPDSIEFERRAGIARIPRHHIRNSGVNVNAMFLPNVREDSIRKALASIYGNRVDNWSIRSAWYNMEWGEWHLVVESPEFDRVVDGCQLPYIEEKPPHP